MTMPKSPAERQKQDRERKKAANMKRVSFWINGSWEVEFKAYVKRWMKNKMTEKCQKEGATENDNSK
jgi:hypothetical protein